jgi:sugar lactone lactonase YvrE
MPSSPFRSLFTSVFRLRSKRGCDRTARPRSRRLQIEALEDRFVPSLTTLVPSGLDSPLGVAVDGSGNVYIADTYDNAIKEWVSATNTVVTLVSSGLSSPEGIAVDASGNVYIADTGDNAIKEWNQASNMVTTLVPSSSGLFLPTGIAVDGNGNVYIADYGRGDIQEWVASSNSTMKLVSTGLNRPSNVAVDTRGNVYIADYGNDAIKEWLASSSTVNTLVSSDLTSPFGIAADSSGNLYIADSGDNAIKEWVASSNTVKTLVSSGLSFPTGIAVDGSGNVYIADYGESEIKELVAPPAITGQPQNASATVGQSGPASFTVTATGSALSYQWQISTDNGDTFTNLSDGPGVSGAATSTLTVSGFATAGAAEYQVVITDGSGETVTSNAATLTINAAPSITTQPQNATVTAGQSASETFLIAAGGGTGPLSVQWEVSTNQGASFSNLSNGNGVAGATGTTLTLSGFAAAGTAEYRAVVSDANGVTAISSPATLTINPAPAITTQPQNAVATVGQAASVAFTIGESGGTGPVTIQWQVSTDNGSSFTDLSNGSGITGATTTTLTLSGLATAGSAEYRAVVTDANGVTATSNAATLTVNAAPADPNQSWLTQVYADLLHRSLDPSGQAAWGKLLSQGDSRTQVVLLIESSLEYRTDEVQALYVQLLHRPADASGLNGFTSFLGDGGTAEQVETAILGSSEYFQLHGGTNESFLAALYQDVLDRSLDPSGAESWGTALAGGITRNALAAAILASLEADTNEIQGLFRDFLHRAADPSGLNSFTTAFQQGLPTETAIAGIVGSEEYFARGQ